MGGMRVDLIDHDPAGEPVYRVRIRGDRRKLVACGHEELLMAVRHYWGMSGHVPSRCPTCKVVREFSHTGKRLKPAGKGKR